LAIPDYIPSTPGVWPGASADALYINFLRLAYIDEMLLRMQQTVPKAAGTATRQVELTGYETRVERWGKATLQQRARGALIGVGPVGVVGPGGTVTIGVASAETPTQTIVIVGEPWEYPEYFDVRDQLGLRGRLNALTSGAYKENVMASFNRKADTIFFQNFAANVSAGTEAGTTLTYTGDGGTTVGEAVKSDGLPVASGSVTSANTAKIAAGHGQMMLNDAFTGPQDNFIGIHATQLTQLFQETTSGTRLTSGDYNALRPLMNGEVTTYMGHTWITTNEIPLVADIGTSAGTQAGHYIYFWNRNAMISGRGVTLAQANYVPERTSELLYQSAFLGTSRVDGTGLTRVPCLDIFFNG
jgi:hypothetical protein